MKFWYVIYLSFLIPSSALAARIINTGGSGGTPSTFAVASFSDSLSATQEACTGVWKASGTINFTATYTAGPPIGSTITYSGWSALPLASPFLSTTSIANVNCPAVQGTVVFTITAQKVGTASRTITHTFNNRRYWGVSPISSGTYSSDDVKALANNDLTDSIANSFTLSPVAGEYIVYAYPSRLGTATFTVDSFQGGFLPAVTASVTNASGYAENYSVYRSFNSNLGTTTVVVTTP